MSAGLAHLEGRNNERQGKGTHFPYEKTERIVCEVLALDQSLPQVSNLSFIKCDIEGAELLAFRGASRIIQQHVPTVLCEINPWFLEGFGIRLDELLDFFREKGYTLYRYEAETGRRRLRAVAPDEVTEDNYLFLHPRHRDRLSSFL
jgi:hypothetical protein